MENFYARSVFFVKDAEESLAFYTQTLGFQLRLPRLVRQTVKTLSTVR